MITETYSVLVIDFTIQKVVGSQVHLNFKVRFMIPRSESVHRKTSTLFFQHILVENFSGVGGEVENSGQIRKDLSFRRDHIGSQEK